jgi:uncharacterized BrkB/YihY/UPF0761 family membrane protein
LGNGSTASSSSGSAQTSITTVAIDLSSYTTSTFGNSSIYIPNYTSSIAKSISNDGTNENNATAASVGFIAGLWTGTSAISTIRMTADTGSYVQYSSFYLYGIKNS